MYSGRTGTTVVMVPQDEVCLTRGVDRCRGLCRGARAHRRDAMTDSRTTGGTRPFRFGVVAPLSSDLPTWRDRVRRFADSGYSTFAHARLPATSALARPDACPRRRPHRPAGGHLGVCLAA